MHVYMSIVKIAKYSKQVRYFFFALFPNLFYTTA